MLSNETTSVSWERPDQLTYRFHASPALRSNGRLARNSVCTVRSCYCLIPGISCAVLTVRTSSSVRHNPEWVADLVIGHRVISGGSPEAVAESVLTGWELGCKVGRRADSLVWPEQPTF